LDSVLDEKREVSDAYLKEKTKLNLASRKLKRIQEKEAALSSTK